jgi:hypothetical protein
MHPSLERKLRQMSDERHKILLRVAELNIEIARLELQVTNEVHEPLPETGLHTDG